MRRLALKNFNSEKEREVLPLFFFPALRYFLQRSRARAVRYRAAMSSVRSTRVFLSLGRGIIGFFRTQHIPRRASSISERGTAASRWGRGGVVVQISESLYHRRAISQAGGKGNALRSRSGVRESFVKKKMRAERGEESAPSFPLALPPQRCLRKMDAGDERRPRGDAKSVPRLKRRNVYTRH